MNNRWRLPLGLVGWTWLAMSAGLAGSRFQPGEWYAGLVKPDWTPPNLVFPVVWTLLYIAMGVAAFRVWYRHGFAGARIALGLWLTQLALNAAWSWIFFGLQAPGAAFFEIILLWGAILATFQAFRQRDRLAARLMLPYLAWVGFAFALNFAIWRLNP
ncbi:MAG TPA: tryptophan-rich sensory protein [Candidatus Krumholzibacteria bacterium]|nr:tryptophan-rich sensory protein [Candidatus Krumholzibacteria bacterium]